MSVIALCMRLVVFALTVIILCLIGDILIFQIINKYFFETINKLLLKIHNSDYEKVKDYDSDDLSGRIFIESRESLSTFIKGLHLIIYNVLLLVFAIIFLAGIQLLLAMIILFANIIIIACLQIFDRKLQKLIKLYVSTRALNRSKLQLVFKNIELIKLTGKYDDEDIEYSNKIDILFKYFTDLRVIEIFLDKILPAITDICRAVSLYFLSMKVLSGNIQLSDLIFFMLLINRINYPFLGFIWSRTGIIESKEIFDRQGEIFHLPEKTENYSVC
jgi:ABC-type bacteriocin/lantibiotic exporter with double-glycine peptidase domain